MFTLAEILKWCNSFKEEKSYCPKKEALKNCQNIVQLLKVVLVGGGSKEGVSNGNNQNSVFYLTFSKEDSISSKVQQPFNSSNFDFKGYSYHLQPFF